MVGHDHIVFQNDLRIMDWDLPNLLFRKQAQRPKGRLFRADAIRPYPIFPEQLLFACRADRDKVTAVLGIVISLQAVSLSFRIFLGK